MLFGCFIVNLLLFPWIGRSVAAHAFSQSETSLSLPHLQHRTVMAVVNPIGRNVYSNPHPPNGIIPSSVSVGHA